MAERRAIVIGPSGLLAELADGDTLRGADGAGALPLVKTASFTFALSDAAQPLEMNSATATTVTIPANATVPFPIGTKLPVRQIGTGQSTGAAASGVTLNSCTGSTTTRTQWSLVVYEKRGTDLWVVDGDTT